MYICSIKKNQAAALTDADPFPAAEDDAVDAGAAAEAVGGAIMESDIGASARGNILVCGFRIMIVLNTST